MHLLKDIEEAALTHHPHPLLSPTPSLTVEEKISTIAHHFKMIMQALELDLSDESLKDTPNRFARMYVEELFWGLDANAFPDVSYLDNQELQKEKSMVLIKDIPIKSICEHHFVPIIGMAKIAYVPKEKILGLSKINRIVDYFCRRPQLQERLTAQIADSLSMVLSTEDIAIGIEAEHFCITLRGIQHPTSRTYTHVLRGCFKDNPLSNVFLKDN